jgi:hypothetical protein
LPITKNNLTVYRDTIGGPVKNQIEAQSMHDKIVFESDNGNADIDYPWNGMSSREEKNKKHKYLIKKEPWRRISVKMLAHNGSLRGNVT